MTVHPSACPKHPNATVRPYRAGGPRGPRVYLQCVPESGEPHFLASASAAGAGLTVRASGGPLEELREAPETASLELPFGLTAAELSVLRAAAQGLTVPETAQELGKGAETVKTQRNRIILKIGARNMTHAVCIAAGHGLVSAVGAL